MSDNQSQTRTRVALPQLVVPLDLWIQWHGDGEMCASDMTWSREKIFEGDIEYVQADEIRHALNGYPCSELLGGNGLIAANMRCVDALNRIEEVIVDANGTSEETVQRIRKILWHNSGVSMTQPPDIVDE